MAEIMTETPPKLPRLPFEDANAEDWWPHVAPNLTPEGRALVQSILTDAATRLEQEAARLAEEEAVASQMTDAAKLLLIKKKRTEARAKFEQTLQNLERPDDEQLAFLADPEHRFEQLKLTESGQRDLSNILICDPETGEAIKWSSYVFPTNIPAVTFHAAIFVGQAIFEESKFMGEAIFQGATFTRYANFGGATFKKLANFQAAHFGGTADFGRARFIGETIFMWAVFGGHANFRDAAFMSSTANFVRTKFKSEATFVDAHFEGRAIFQQAKFVGEADFLGAQFAGEAFEAFFFGATFEGRANFQQAKFAGEANFWGAQFVGEAFEASFWGATFKKLANFSVAKFAGAANFLNAEFIDQAIFKGATFTGVANFDEARFGKIVSFRESSWGAVPNFVGTAFKDGMAISDLENLRDGLTKGVIDWRTDSDLTTINKRLQILRKMARDADDRPTELDYFAPELQSRYPRMKKADETPKKEKGWLWPKWLLVWLYGLFSDYGRGIGRPFGWLAGLWVGCALGYALLIKNAPPIALWLCLTVWALFIGATIDLWLFDRRQKSSLHPKNHWWVLWGACVGQWGWLLWSIPQYGNALSLSLVNALPALGVASEARKSSLEALYGCVECVPAVVHVIGVVEGVAAILLLFLIGLGLRNRFRL
jgi:uncharacterized protein YjbI with pentapeptide repeats